MQGIQKTSNTELTAKDKILLEEYKTLLSSVNSINDWQHRYATFYFTSASFLLGAVFLIISGDFTTKNNFIMIGLSALGLILSLFWLASASRAQVKLSSRVKRAKKIEDLFHEEYREYTGMFRYTARHLDRNKDSEDKDLNFFERRRRILSRKYPITLGAIWLVMLLIGLVLLLFDISTADQWQELDYMMVLP
jgi:hypothetical protein